MSTTDVEVLGTNIVVLTAAPLTDLAKAPALFESDELKPLLRGVTATQVLQIDASSGATAPMLAFESMRSQKIVNIGTNRIDVNDRSGDWDFDAEVLAHILEYVVRQLEASVRAVGVNLDLTFPAPDDQNSAQAIAKALFAKRKDYVLDDMESLGGTGRLILQQVGGVRYTVTIEPRFNSLETTELFMTSNANIATEEVPSVEGLAKLARENRRVLAHVAHALFSVSW